MTVEVRKTIEISKEKIYFGIFEGNVYTGNAATYFGAPNIEDIQSGIGAGYRRYVDVTYTNFSGNFIPKMGVPYLCIPKVNSCKKGNTTYTKVLLTNPIELIPRSINEEGLGNDIIAEWVEGICQKTGFIASGYISADNDLYWTNGANYLYPIELTYQTIENVFFISSYTVTDSDTTFYEDYENGYIGRMYPSLGSSKVTEFYRNLHFHLRNLVSNNLENLKMNINKKEVQGLVGSEFEVRKPKILMIGIPQEEEYKNNYLVDFWFEFRKWDKDSPRDDKEYTGDYDWYGDNDKGWTSVTKRFMFLKSSFSQKAKNYIFETSEV